MTMKSPGSLDCLGIERRLYPVSAAIEKIEEFIRYAEDAGDGSHLQARDAALTSVAMHMARLALAAHQAAEGLPPDARPSLDGYRDETMRRIVALIGGSR